MKKIYVKNWAVCVQKVGRPSHLKKILTKLGTLFCDAYGQKSFLHFFIFCSKVLHLIFKYFVKIFSHFSTWKNTHLAPEGRLKKSLQPWTWWASASRLCGYSQTSTQRQLYVFMTLLRVSRLRVSANPRVLKVKVKCLKWRETRSSAMKT